MTNQNKANNIWEPSIQKIQRQMNTKVFPFRKLHKRHYLPLPGKARSGFHVGSALMDSTVLSTFDTFIRQMAIKRLLLPYPVGNACKANHSLIWDCPSDALSACVWKIFSQSRSLCHHQEKILPRIIRNPSRIKIRKLHKRYRNVDTPRRDIQFL